MIRRTPIRRVSKKRAAANAIYSKLRKEFLAKHPYCQWFLKYHGIDEKDVTPLGVVVLMLGFTEKEIRIPLSSEIHHMKKPKCKYLNDMSTWMAVSRQGHEWIENNKSQAREMGMLYDI